MSFIEVLNIPEAREMIEAIEELLKSTDTRSVRIRKALINELQEKYGYEYIIN